MSEPWFGIPSPTIPEDSRGPRLVDRLADQFPQDLARLQEKEMNRLFQAGLDGIQAKLGKSTDRVSWVGEEHQVVATVRDVIEDLDLHSRRTLPRALLLDVQRALTDELLGYGPIQMFLEDPLVTEIMANGWDQVYIEKKGYVIRCDGTQTDRDGKRVPLCRFRNNDHLVRIIRRIVDPLGRGIDIAHPMVDARIKGGIADGSRVNAVIPPLAIDGPLLTIRKFRKDVLTAESLVRNGTFTNPVADFLDACVRARLNIIVSGGTGSGKTTMLNILSNFIPDEERIITIEDSAELQIQKRHVLRLETKPATADQKEDFSIRKLVRNTLRMRPDRIVVGECRGEEALDMLQAMNTGHDGCLTTVHANSPRSLMSRLETMVLLSGFDLPVRAIQQQIVDAIHLVIQTEKIGRGRRVSAVSEVVEIGRDGVVVKDLLLYRLIEIRSDGEPIGHLEATGHKPRFLDKIQKTVKRSFEEMLTPSQNQGGKGHG